MLRFCPPALRSLGYKAYEEIELSNGIKIPKDQIITFNLFGAHSNPNEWYEPKWFIPEWFDPDSKYFKKPDGQNRHALAYCPFTFGEWACPGRALAMMEFKIMMIYMIKRLDYKISNEILSNPYLCFSVGSDDQLFIEV